MSLGLIRFLQSGPWLMGKMNREGGRPKSGDVGRRRRGEGGQGGEVGQGEPADGVEVKDWGLDGARRR